MTAALLEGMHRIVSLLLLGASAGLLSSAWLTLALIPEPDASRTSPVASASAGPLVGSVRVAPLCRNIFDSSGSLCDEPVVPPSPAAFPDALCQAAPRLIATWVVATDPARSVAVFAGAATPLAAGSKLGSQTLSRVGTMSAWLVDDAGQACACRLFDSGADAAESVDAHPPDGFAGRPRPRTIRARPTRAPSDQNASHARRHARGERATDHGA